MPKSVEREETHKLLLFDHCRPVPNFKASSIMLRSRWSKAYNLPQSNLHKRKISQYTQNARNVARAGAFLLICGVIALIRQDRNGSPSDVPFTMYRELDDWASQDAHVQFPAELFGTPDAKQELRAHLIDEQSEPHTHTGYHHRMTSESNAHDKKGQSHESGLELGSHSTHNIDRDTAYQPHEKYSYKSHHSHSHRSNENHLKEVLNRNRKRLEQERQHAIKAQKLRTGGRKESPEKAAQTDHAKFRDHIDARKAKVKKFKHVPPHGKHGNRNTAVAVEMQNLKDAEEDRHAIHTSAHGIESRDAAKASFIDSDHSIHTHEHAQDGWDDHPGYHGAHDGESWHDGLSHGKHATNSEDDEYDDYYHRGDFEHEDWDDWHNDNGYEEPHDDQYDHNENGHNVDSHHKDKSGTESHEARHEHDHSHEYDHYSHRMAEDHLHH